MANFVAVTYSGDNPSIIYINLDNVISMQRFDKYTQIFFNVSITGQNGGFLHTIGVVETPAAILGNIIK